MKSRLVVLGALLGAALPALAPRVARAAPDPKAADDYREKKATDPTAPVAPGTAPAGGVAATANAQPNGGLEPPPLATPAAGNVVPPPPQPPSPWQLLVFGYLRAGYDYTTKDPTFDFVGRNNGFVLDAARVGLDGANHDYDLAWRISLEGASGELSSPNTPIGSLAVRLRDAFFRWDPTQWIGLQVGQMKAPFQEEELRSTSDLLFASRAVGVDGVLPGRGFQTPGIQLDRQLGVMLSPVKPIGSTISVTYYLMVMNGNGSNQLLDDNGKPGLVARSEVAYQKYVKLGAGIFHDTRTVGTLPNLYDEEDLGLTGDLTVKVAGLEAFAAVTRLQTVFPTVGTAERVQLAAHAQLGYRIEKSENPTFFVMPAYRFAYFHPWQSGGDSGFDAFKLQYHTFGVRLGHEKVPIQLWIDYTLTQEEAARQLTNDRLEVLGQVTF